MPLDAVRDQRLRTAMAEHELDAVLAWHVEEVVLTTGECPHLGMTLCLYPRVGTPITYTPGAEPPDLMPDYFPQRRYKSVRDDLKTLLSDDMKALSINRIGYAVDTGQHALPGNVAEYTPLNVSLIASLLDTVEAVQTDLFAQQMQRKTPHEVEKIVRCNQIAAYGLRRFFELLQPGRTEAEIAGEIELVVQSQTGKHGCKLARGWACVQAAEHTFTAGGASRSSGYTLKNGDIVLLEFGAIVDGYYCDLTRVGVVGGASESQQALIDAVRAAQRAAIETLKPGVTHEAVDAAARQVLIERGYGEGFTHITGHPVGFRYHDYGDGLAPGVTTTLQEGNVFTVEPGAYGAQFGGGCRFEDNVLVTEDGYHILSPYDVVE